MLSLKYFHIIFLISTFGIVNGRKLQAKLITASKCTLPPGKLRTDSPVQYNVTSKKMTRHLTVFSAYFNIVHKYGPVSFTGRAFQIKQNTVKDLVFKAEHISCHNPIMFQIIRMANITYDKDCYFPAGSFKVENLDINNYKWVLTKPMVASGKYAYEMEFSDAKGVCACVHIVCDIIMQP